MRTASNDPYIHYVIHVTTSLYYVPGRPPLPRERGYSARIINWSTGGTQDIGGFKTPNAAFEAATKLIKEAASAARLAAREAVLSEPALGPAPTADEVALRLVEKL